MTFCQVVSTNLYECITHCQKGESSEADTRAEVLYRRQPAQGNGLKEQTRGVNTLGTKIITELNKLEGKH